LNPNAIALPETWRVFSFAIIVLADRHYSEWDGLNEWVWCESDPFNPWDSSSYLSVITKKAGRPAENHRMALNAH
jgi:hypothetical protein